MKGSQIKNLTKQQMINIQALDLAVACNSSSAYLGSCEQILDRAKEFALFIESSNAPSITRQSGRGKKR